MNPTVHDLGDGMEGVPERGGSVPVMSVVVCTRNRGDSIVATIETILANTFPSFEILVIDQSTDNATRHALQRFDDQRLRYVQTATTGKGRALNLAVCEARGEYIVITDDDCTVPPNWIEVIVNVFTRFSRVAVVFTNVEPAPHDHTRGYIPHYIRRDSKLVRTMWDKVFARGIGASIAVRRAAVKELGGWDVGLGPGSKFPSADDYDISIRALLKGFWVYETHEVSVVHHGFRTFDQLRQLSRRDWVAVGAAYAKPIKCRRWNVVPAAAYEVFVEGVFKPLSSILSLRPPQGLRRSIYFWLGFVEGLRTPLDHQHLVYTLD
jgi:glycosyltransferase involved in cell wall biosynthesis